MESTKKEKKETVTNEKKEKIKEEKKESKEEKEKIKEESKETTTEVVEESNEEEAKEEESTSKTSTASVVSTKKKAEQKKVQSKKALVKNIDRVMDKIDRDIKDLSKNLIIKNLIKLEAMASEQASLTDYNNVEFYKPKDIYLDQLNMFDHRKIYSNVTLTSYIKNDTLEIKTKKLNEIYYKKQKLLMELKELKNG
jgi:chemotaxis protein histidine kinase CheA